MNFKEAVNLVEALIYSSKEPLTEKSLIFVLEKHGKFDLKNILKTLIEDYKKRGINLVSVKNRWFFRTSLSLSDYLKVETEKKKKLSQVTIETLSIISYHQPVTRAEIESIRGKPVFKGTLDILMDLNWIKPYGRRETPGRPVTWVTDIEFLKHFGLSSINDLPKIDELEPISK